VASSVVVGETAPSKAMKPPYFHGKIHENPGRFSLKPNHPLTLKLVEQKDFFFRNYPTIHCLGIIPQELSKLWKT
jgi:hypothetical protein